VINSDKLVHFSVQTLIGGVARNTGTKQRISLLVIEIATNSLSRAGATLDLNVTSWMRFSVGASYRWVDWRGFTGLDQFRFKRARSNGNAPIWEILRESITKFFVQGLIYD